MRASVSVCYFLTLAVLFRGSLSGEVGISDSVNSDVETNSNKKDLTFIEPNQGRHKKRPNANHVLSDELAIVCAACI